MTLAHPIRLVSWDVDGTLYSIGRMKWHLRWKFMREVAAGRGRVARREIAALLHYRDQVNSARLSGGALSELFLKQNCREELLELEKRWYGPAIQQTGPRKRITNAISFLTKIGIPQVVISDYEATYKLEALGLADRFASIYVGERLGFVKPSPELFQRAAADFNASKSACLHIGDRVDRDYAAAHAAGWQCLILGRDFRAFDELIDLIPPAVSDREVSATTR